MEIKIGICGGTFDPIHVGHIASARAARAALGLSAVVFVPGGEPPHKLDRRILPASDRLEMVRRAISEENAFYLSEYETSKAGLSYSVETLRFFHAGGLPEEVKKLCGADDFFTLYYIIGADILPELSFWKDSEEVFRLCRFAALLRPGYDRDAFEKNLARNRENGAKIEFVEMPQVDVSSREIRARRQAGKSVTGLVPTAVEQYILEKNLYAKPLPFDKAYALSDMKARLKPDRFAHTQRVAEESARIAEQYGLDREKCYIGGLLHDCAKGITEKQLHWLAPELIPLCDETRGGSPAIVHGPAGAVIAEKKYGIMDKEILDAVRFHVTGAPGMSPVAQAVFIADYAEPGRTGEAFDRVRAALNKSLTDAVIQCCDESIGFIIRKGQVIHPQTIETRNYFICERNKKEKE